MSCICSPSSQTTRLTSLDVTEQPTNTGKRFLFAAMIIAGLGAMVVAAMGLSALQGASGLGALQNLSQIEALSMVVAGGVGGLALFMTGMIGTIHFCTPPKLPETHTTTTPRDPVTIVPDEKKKEAILSMLREGGPVSPRGLRNKGSDCFANSLLQLIIHSPVLQMLVESKFEENLEELEAKLAENDLEEDEVEALEEKINNRKAKGKFHTDFIDFAYRYMKKERLNSNQLRTHFPELKYGQQDAGELLIQIFDGLDLQRHLPQVKMEREANGEGVVIDEYIVEYDEKIHSRRRSERTQHEAILNLPIPEEATSFEACWEAFEQDQDHDDYKFLGEDGKTYKTEGFTTHQELVNQPDFLFFQYNRFNNDREKIRTALEMPLEVSLGDGTYGVQGFVSHGGSLCGGHYWSYAKVGETWYKFNDSSKTRCDQQAVEDALKAAYIILLVKV